MAQPLDAIKSQIKNLNAPEKAELLKVLVAELESRIDAGVAEAWLAEAERRHAELAAGAVAPIPASVVFARARERLKA